MRVHKARTWVTALVAATLVLTACSGAAAPSPTAVPTTAAAPKPTTPPTAAAKPSTAPTAAATAAPAVASKKYPGETLRVTIFGGTWQEAFKGSVLPHFEAETGAKIEIIPGTNADWLAKLRAAHGVNPPADVILLLPHDLRVAIAGNLLLPPVASKNTQ